MTKDKSSRLLATSSLATVFTIALTFATIELPRLFNNMLSQIFPDIHPIIEPELIEEFLRKVRPLGYASLLLVISLIVVSFKTGKRRYNKLGALAFFLPVFGSFASQMFFLAGIGIIRVIWLPFWEISPSLMKLGDIAYLPYMILVYPFSLIGLDTRLDLAYLFIGLGLMVFLMGTITWLQAKFSDMDVVDFWIYRYSRHPQYLGYILWSYGVMLIATLYPIPRGGINPGPSLPWLISALLIICLAFNEENTMMRLHSEDYIKYRSNSPFMIPLPNFISKAVTSPLKIWYKVNTTRNSWDNLYLFVIYLGLLVLLSLPFFLLNYPPGLGWMTWPKN
jgi:protein-S-isoprenylcysteine O-methyltransferase Ste14